MFGRFGLRPQHCVEDEVRNIMGRRSVFSLDEGHALSGVGGYPIGYFV